MVVFVQAAHVVLCHHVFAHGLAVPVLHLQQEPEVIGGVAGRDWVHQRPALQLAVRLRGPPGPARGDPAATRAQAAGALHVRTM